MNRCFVIEVFISDKKPIPCIHWFFLLGSRNGVEENNTGSKDVLTAALHVVKGNCFSFQNVFLFVQDLT